MSPEEKGRLLIEVIQTRHKMMSKQVNAPLLLVPPKCQSINYQKSNIEFFKTNFKYMDRIRGQVSTHSPSERPADTPTQLPPTSTFAHHNNKYSNKRKQKPNQQNDNRE